MNQTKSVHQSGSFNRRPANQRGAGMITVILYFLVAAVVGLVGLKLLPQYLEYFSVKKVIASMAAGEEVKSGTVADIRSSFDRRASIDNITAIKGADLDITKENNETIVVATWQPRIALIPGYTLLVDFTVSSADK